MCKLLSPISEALSKKLIRQRKTRRLETAVMNGELAEGYGLLCSNTENMSCSSSEVVFLSFPERATQATVDVSTVLKLGLGEKGWKVACEDAAVAC